MAPEIIIGKSGYDHSSDIWSFGIILYQLATGVQPYAHLSPMDSMIEIATKPPPSFDEDKPFSSSFVNFVSSCLTSKPKKRANVSVLLNHPFITEEEK
jgi:serine/threonine protein kinase